MSGTRPSSAVIDKLIEELRAELFAESDATLDAMEARVRRAFDAVLAPYVDWERRAIDRVAYRRRRALRGPEAWGPPEDPQ